MTPSRPQILRGITIVKHTGSGKVYTTINHDASGAPVEVFVSLGRAGSEERALTEAIGRLLSTSIQRGVPLRALTKQLRGISSESVMGLGPRKILSVPDAVAQSLEEVQ